MDSSRDLSSLTKIFIGSQETDKVEETEELITQSEMSGDESASNSWYPNIWNNAVQEDPWLPSMTKKQRLMGFMACLMGGWLCFGLSLIYIPFILLKARKFVLLFSLGSVFTMASFSMLWGPWNHIQHLLKRDRLPFTLSYLSTLSGTIYVAMVMKSTILTIICCFFQFAALLWYVFSYVPGGITGLKFFTKMISRTMMKSAQNVLPI